MFFLDLTFWALTFDVIGKIIIAYTAIRVHDRVRHEHKIDSDVFKIMQRERVAGLFGILFFVTGYILKLIEHYGLM